MSPNYEVTRGADVMQKTTELQLLLHFHDKAIQQIVLLDNYINRLNTMALMSLFNGNGSYAVRLTNRKLIAEGLKYIYKYYRLQKWYKVQQLVTGLIHSIRDGDVIGPPQQPRAPRGFDVDSVYDFAPGMVYAQCSGGRSN